MIRYCPLDPARFIVGNKPMRAYSLTVLSGHSKTSAPSFDESVGLKSSPVLGCKSFVAADLALLEFTSLCASALFADL